MRSERFSDFLYRYRFALFGVWLVHLFLWHYIALGYMSWDGFSYRIGPVIELLQHGALGKEKYPLDWSLRGYLPFLELIHIPFLYLFGMKGLIIGFPLVVFPLCVCAVFLVMRELTGDRRAGTFGAFAYAAIPMMNQQPFTGYIDFAVAGILAYWVYAVVRLRAEERRLWTFARLVLATILLSMARTQGLYIIIVMLPILLFAMFVERTGLRLRVVNWRAVALAAAAFLIGVVPSVVTQVLRYINYGSPISPAEFKLFGIVLAPGVPLGHYMIYAGIGGDSIAQMARGFFEGFLWHAHWPIGAFYGSRFMATGLIGILGVLLLPVFVRRATRVEGWLAASCVIVSVLSRDYAVPRWSYSLMLVLILIVARSMAELVSSRRGQPLFWLGCLVLVSHLFRPEVDAYQVKAKEVITSRMNVTESSRFIRSGWVLLPYPDGHHRLVLVGETGFVAQLFGLHLTNEVVETVFDNEIQPGCKRLARYLAEDPKTLFVDMHDHTKNCARECAFKWGDTCGAFRITPSI